MKVFKAYIGVLKSPAFGRRAKLSSAKYPLSASVSTDQLKKTLAVYDYWADEQNKSKTLWQVALNTRICPSMENKLLDAQYKNYLSVAASKRITRAQVLIDNVGRGRFPDNTDNRKQS